MSKVIIIALDHHRNHTYSSRNYHIHITRQEQIFMSIGQLLLLRYSISGLSRPFGYEANKSQLGGVMWQRQMI
jgi:hypothetical protein